MNHTTKASVILALIAIMAIQARAQGKLDLVGSPTLISTGTANLTIGSASTGDLIVKTNDTERLRFDDGGEVQNKAISCTAAATPAAGTNDLKGYVAVIPTAAANAACILPTPAAVGIEKRIINTGGNTVRVKAGGTNTINGATAGGWLPLAAGGVMDCVSSSTTNWGCDVARAAPTPQGP